MMNAVPATGINARVRFIAWTSMLERTYREINQWNSRSMTPTLQSARNLSTKAPANGNVASGPARLMTEEGP